MRDGAMFPRAVRTDSSNKVNIKVVSARQQGSESRRQVGKHFPGSRGGRAVCSPCVCVWGRAKRSPWLGHSEGEKGRLRDEVGDCATGDLLGHSSQGEMEASGGFRPET